MDLLPLFSSEESGGLHLTATGRGGGTPGGPRSWKRTGHLQREVVVQRGRGHTPDSSCSHWRTTRRSMSTVWKARRSPTNERRAEQAWQLHLRIRSESLPQRGVVTPSSFRNTYYGLSCMNCGCRLRCTPQPIVGRAPNSLQGLSLVVPHTVFVMPPSF